MYNTMPCHVILGLSGWALIYCHFAHGFNLAIALEAESYKLTHLISEALVVGMIRAALLAREDMES
jgi:hypothetical protein